MFIPENIERFDGGWKPRRTEGKRGNWTLCDDRIPVPSLSQAPAARSSWQTRCWSYGVRVIWVQRLPNELQRELNLARRDLEVGDLSEAGGKVAAGVEGFHIVYRRRKVGVIQDIEEFRPELDVEIF
jgi:hypothetical protein